MTHSEFEAQGNKNLNKNVCGAVQVLYRMVGPGRVGSGRIRVKNVHEATGKIGGITEQIVTNHTQPRETWRNSRLEQVLVLIQVAPSNTLQCKSFLSVLFYCFCFF